MTDERHIALDATDICLIRDALQVVDPDSPDGQQRRETLEAIFDELVDGGRFDFTLTVHPIKLAPKPAEPFSEEALLYDDGTVIRGYHVTIARATGERNRKRLDALEDCMRHDIFHSTLDWQTREELEIAARQAVDVVRGLSCRVPDDSDPDPWPGGDVLGHPGFVGPRS